MTHLPLRDRGRADWIVGVQDGDVSSARAAATPTAIVAPAETFEKIVTGEQNPTTAYMTGKLKIKGDMGAAMKLQKIF